MNISCTQCGKRYTVDTDRMQQDSLTFKCKLCQEPITVKKPRKQSSAYGAKTSQVKTQGISLRVKLPLIIVFLAVLSLAVAGFYASHESETALAAQAQKNIETTMSLKTYQYDYFFKRLKEELVGVANYSSAIFNDYEIPQDQNIKVLMPWTGSAYGSPELDEKLFYETRQLQQISVMLKSIVPPNPYLILGYVTTMHKTMVFDDEKVVDIIAAEKAYDPSKRPWFIGALKKQATNWSAPYVDVNSKKLVVTCSTPVYDKKKSVIAIAAFDILLDTIKRDVLTLDIGYNGYAFLVDKDGNVLARPGMNAQDSRWDTAYKTDNFLKTSNSEFNTIVGKMTQGQSGVDMFHANGAQKYLAYAKLPEIGASVGIVVDRSEVVQPAMEIRNRIILGCLVVIILAILVGIYLGNAITRPIKELTVLVDQVSQGRIDLSLLPEKRKDEIGVLTKSFNRLIISLKMAMKR